MGIFERDKLPLVANVEQVWSKYVHPLFVLTLDQNCATGLTPEGKPPKQLVEEMVPILDSREVMYATLALLTLHPTYSSHRNANKVRIIALYIQFREGVPDEDRRRLYQHARLSLAEQDAVNALTQFGVRISRVRHGFLALTLKRLTFV